MSFQSAMELPKDLERGLAVLTVFGDGELHVQNHRGILAFDSNCIQILSRKGRIAISGERLWIRYYDREEIHVIGQIRGISIC
ncbi:MAG: sporulation protein [Lachnospiraceae bacterium]|nr:sporulation protein [Lachnospiraceae bacterium]